MFADCRKSIVLFPADYRLVVGGIRGMESHCRYVDWTYYRLYFVVVDY
jgi:hypothetical protein